MAHRLTPNEEDVFKQVTGGLDLYRVRWWRIAERIPNRKYKWQRLSTPGIPDLYCRKGPVQFWIELKKPGGRRGQAQEIFVSEARMDGALAFFADSWDVVYATLKSNGIIE